MTLTRSIWKVVLLFGLFKIRRGVVGNQLLQQMEGIQRHQNLQQFINGAQHRQQQQQKQIGINGQNHNRILLSSSSDNTQQIQITEQQQKHREQHLLQYLLDANATEELQGENSQILQKLQTLTFGANGVTFSASLELINPCTNIPPNVHTDCSNLSPGLCNLPAITDGQYCLRSCGRCCKDIEYLGSCSVLADLGLCAAPEVLSGDYCAKTCGRCEGGPVPPPSPSPPPPPTPPAPPSPPPPQGCAAPTAIACDAQALMEFHDQMSPIAQTSLSSWSWGTDPCTRNWKGVTCQDVDGGTRRVTEIRASFEYLRTSIPPMFSLIHYLTVLDLDQCNLTGTLPSQLSLLKNLKQLDLWKNEITGTLPPEYSALNNIQEMHFSFNSFSGEVPVQYSELLPLSYFYVEPQTGGKLCMQKSLRDDIINQASQTNALSVQICT